MTTTFPVQLVNARVAAQHLGVTTTWLARDRRGPKLIPFVRMGNGPKAPVRYDLARCAAVLQQRERGGVDAVAA
jgi:hypothetical protein